MGFYFRRSVNLGPFRVNLSKSGVGYSVGGAGFRTGRSAKGRRYTSFNVPGTGMGYRTSGSKAGCAIVLAGGVLAVGGVLAAGAWAAAEFFA